MLKYYRKKTLLKKCGPQMVFLFRPIMLKELHSYLGGLELTHPTAVRGIPSSVQFPVWRRYFMQAFLFYLCVFAVFCQKHMFCQKHIFGQKHISFVLLIHLVYLTYCKRCEQIYHCTDIASLNVIYETHVFHCKS